jgi:HK97 family phage major capsid protein
MPPKMQRANGNWRWRCGKALPERAAQRQTPNGPHFAGLFYGRMNNMASIQALREQRDAQAKVLQDLVNPDRAWDAEKDQPIYDAGMKAIDDYDAKIERIRKVNELAASTALTHSIEDATNRAARNFGASAKIEAFANWLRNPDGNFDNTYLEKVMNTMSTGVGAEGGFTVATDVATSVLDAMKSFGGMRAVATVLRTAGGNPMSFPASDGTAEEGEIVAENATTTALDLAFSTISLPVYKYSSKSVAVPIELLQDSSVDVEGFVTNRLIQRLGRITNKHFTIGSGVSQPTGLITAAAVGRTGIAGQTVTVLYDDLVRLEHSVDPAYREGGRAGYMMHDTSVLVVRLIKDTQGRPIFVPGYESSNPGGAPDRLMGSPITINQHMPVMAANAESIAFGALSEYTIRDAMDISMRRFDDSAFGLKGQIGFCAWLRSGGNLLDIGGAVKTYQNPAT